MLCRRSLNRGKICIPLVEKILEKVVLGISKASKEIEFNRAKISVSSQYISQLIRHTIPKYKLRKSKLSRLSSSHNSISHVPPVEVRKTLEYMIEMENMLHYDSSVFANVDSAKTETVVRRNYKEFSDVFIGNDVTINGSLNPISQNIR